MAKIATNACGAMLLPNLVQVTESISGSVVPLAMFSGWVVLEEELSAHENKFRFGFDLLKDLCSLVVLVGWVGCKVGADEITFRFGFDLLPLLLSFARWLLLRMHLELALMDTIALFCLVFLVGGLSCGNWLWALLRFSSRTDFHFTPGAGRMK